MTDAETLRSLMDADRWIERVRGQRQHLPEAEELTGVETELRGLSSALRAAQDAQAPVRQAQSEARREVERLERRARDLAARLEAPGTSARDLSAIQGEIDVVRQVIATTEDRELELLLELEPLDEAVEAVKVAAGPLVERRGALQAQVGELRASLDEELNALRESRESTAAHLSGPLRERYEAALARAGVSGASQLVDGRCDGCRLSLSPLDRDRVTGQAPGEFASCPECGRILLP